MCVIAVSEKGKDIPSVEQIKAMWKKNPDGAGYAFVGKGGHIFYRKGFMTLDKLLEELKNPEKFKNTLFAIHFRIGTSGKNDENTCHPFPVTNDYRELRKMEGMSDTVLFHNGILADGGIVAPNSSDTQDFVVAMSPLLKKYNQSKARDYYINSLVEGNRLFVMYKNGRFKMYGGWKKDGDLWVSNLLYKDDYKWSGYGYYYDKGWWDEWYEKQWGSKKDITTTLKMEKKDVTEEVQELWAEIVKKQYKFVSETELQTLIRTADGLSEGEYLEYSGYGFGYDREQGLVWLEIEPDDYQTDTTQEEIEKGGETK